ncbi:MAG: DUF4040 domain-containing protein, partial [Serpentinimonas sp.]|nr:DUF4040 domain-containing protein [Serpentinimonas sp.]
DLLLALALLLLAGSALLARSVQTASVLFIAFGLLLALVWVRLGAPDVALAEAAIGAGVAGALLMLAASEFESRRIGGSRAAGPRLPWPRPQGWRPRWALVLLALACAAVLLLAVLAIEPLAGAATEAVARNLPQSEIAHPVTAVLLSFRAYDTLLEIAVLLVAVVAVQAAPAPPQRALAHDPVLARVAAITVPLALLVALYLLWAGSSRSGGAFQAGAVLAGAVLLARFASLPLDPQSRLTRPPVLALGLALFILIGLVAGALAGAALGYPSGWVKPLVLAIEAALMVSIGATLVALFGGSKTA